MTSATIRMTTLATLLAISSLALPGCSGDDDDDGGGSCPDRSGYTLCQRCGDTCEYCLSGQECSPCGEPCGGGGSGTSWDCGCDVEGPGFYAGYTTEPCSSGYSESQVEDQIRLQCEEESAATYDRSDLTCSCSCQEGGSC